MIYATQPPVALIRENEFRIPSDRIATGIALATTADGNVVALFDNPSCLIVWDNVGHFIGEFGGSPNDFFTPTDISCDGGMELIISDPFLQNRIIRFNRHLEQLSPIILDVGDERFEPRSLCRTRDGTLLILNQADGDVYRLGPDGRAIPFQHSYHRALNNHPTHIAYVADLNRVVVLAGHQLIICTPFGKYIQEIHTGFDNPTGIGVGRNEIWIVGAGLVCIKLTNYSDDGQECPPSPNYREHHRSYRYLVPSDSLIAWDIFPCKDVLPVSEDELFLLPANGGRVVMMKIIRKPNRLNR
ncbi:MAG: hypothetical protein P9M15_01660 [Candidatus Electryoneaceae bacterium]|nr:hypothetical protein [Candidatus Electryoneaceae bacterium]